jgi:hypothetical protein
MDRQDWVDDPESRSAQRVEPGDDVVPATLDAADHAYSAGCARRNRAAAAVTIAMNDPGKPHRIPRVRPTSLFG